MFVWLKRLFHKSDRYDLYAPGERQIYAYFNGQEIVRADPMALYKTLMDFGPELDVDIKVARSASKDAGKAHEAVLAKTRAIFSLKLFKDGGLTDQEVIDLLDHFSMYITTIKKNSMNSASLSASVETSAACSADAPATSSSSPSISSSNGCSTVKPEPLPSASVSL